MKHLPAWMQKLFLAKIRWNGQNAAMGFSDRNNVKRFCLPGVDFSRLAFMDMLCDLDLGVLMTDDKGILIFYNDI